MKNIHHVSSGKFVRRSLIAAMLLAATGAFAHDEVSADFGGHALGNQFDFVDATAAKWPSNTLSYYYNPANAPASITQAMMESTIKAAMARWSNVCNINFSYKGITSRAVNLDTNDGVPVIGWGQLTGTRAAFGGYTNFWWNGSTMVDANMVINTQPSAPGVPFSAALIGQLEGLITHEVGHMLAIQHSNVQNSIMYATPYNSLTFQRTLRGDDVAACVKTYGTSAQSQANRVMNWAEVTLPTYFAPGVGYSTDVGGNQVRTYTASKSAIGISDSTGQVAVTLAGWPAPLVAGTVAGFMPGVVAAGF